MLREVLYSKIPLGSNFSISILDIIKIIFTFAVVIILVTIFKRLLKKVILTKLKIEEGNQEAISTIISYSSGTFAFLIIIQSNGFDISSLAVIGGGVGVGLGLGLQDITKNFISGLTLMLERKLRIGDFIELTGLGIDGFIKEISLRSTMIRTRRGANVIIPNNKMAENMIINWSYDSFVARIHIPVGVAYSSDPVLVTEVLLQSAYMESSVVHDPTPEVIFMGFGDSVLNFELWVWICPINREPQIKTSLYFIIEYNLRQHGIEVPFPQLEMWLRNSEIINYPWLQGITPENAPPTPPADTKMMENLRSITQPPAFSTTNKPKPLALRTLLSKVVYFRTFTELELRKLIEMGYRKRIMAQQVLFHEDDPGDAFYIILSGRVEVYSEKINKHLTFLEAGQFFGELALMLAIPRTASIKAAEDTILFVLNRKCFEHFLKIHPDLAEVIIQELSNRQEELIARQEQLRKSGMLNEEEDDTNPVAWVRKRLKTLFNF